MSGFLHSGGRASAPSRAAPGHGASPACPRTGLSWQGCASMARLSCPCRPSPGAEARPARDAKKAARRAWPGRWRGAHLPPDGAETGPSLRCVPTAPRGSCGRGPLRPVVGTDPSVSRGPSGRWRLPQLRSSARPAPPAYMLRGFRATLTPQPGRGLCPTPAPSGDFHPLGATSSGTSQCLLEWPFIPAPGQTTCECVCVCACVCGCECMFLHVCSRVCLCVHACLRVHMHVRVWSSVCVCAWVCL